MLLPKAITKLPLGFTEKPPPNHYAQIMSRSSLALKGITCYGGVIDPDYRDKINIIFHNTSTNTHLLQQGQ
jgi:dUTPase